MSLPEVDQLRCFLAAAQARNFRRAAEVVHLTPAALGKQIQRLEERVGAELFVRTTRHVRLSPRGEQLVDKARQALVAMEACERLEESPTRLAGQLTIGSRHELAVSWLVPIAHKLAQTHPSLWLNIYVGSGQDLLLRVRSGEVDCAVTSSRFTDAVLEFERLHDEEYVLVASPKLLKRQPLRSDKDAALHTLLDISGELPLFRYWADAAPVHPRLRFPRVLGLGTIAIIREYVLAERGVAVLPFYFVQEELRRKRLVVPFPDVTPQRDAFRLIFRRADGRQSLFRELAAVLRAQPLR
jgi:LysR family transcriptional regulator, glycine cleavage system transcriptional activator